MDSFSIISYILFENKKSIPSFKNPKQLFNWMGKNIDYGWMDKNHKRYNEFGNTWWDNYSLMLPEEVYKYKLGTCYEQTIFEYYVFNRDFSNLESKMIFIAQYGKKNMNADTHTFLIYRNKDDKSKWYWFENSWSNIRGIRGPYNSEQELIKDYKNISKKLFKDRGHMFWYTVMKPERFLYKKLTSEEFYKAVDYPYMDD